MITVAASIVVCQLRRLNDLCLDSTFKGIFFVRMLSIFAFLQGAEYNLIEGSFPGGNNLMEVIHQSAVDAMSVFFGSPTIKHRGIFVVDRVA